MSNFNKKLAERYPDLHPDLHATFIPLEDVTARFVEIFGEKRVHAFFRDIARLSQQREQVEEDNEKAS